MIFAFCSWTIKGTSYPKPLKKFIDIFVWGSNPLATRLIRNLLGIGMGGHIRALYMVPDMDQITLGGVDASTHLGWDGHITKLRGPLGV